MIKTTKLLLLALFCTGFSLAQAQQSKTEAFYRQQKDTTNYPFWIEMMQDPTANFFKTQQAFKAYWKDREITKGAGWKPFKRWENYMSTRVLANGDRIPEGQIVKAYRTFQQKYPATRSFAGNWINLGPIEQPGNAGTGQPNGLGRINAIAFHPTDVNTLLIGAPAGGLWKSTDQGQSWTSNTDNLPTLGVSSIVYDFDQPETIYMGTGDRDAGDAPGLGVMKSTDGGETWSFAKDGMGDAVVGRLIIHPEDAQTLLAATSQGIFKTTDAAANWTAKANGNYKEIVFHPTNPDLIYAMSGSTFSRSTDGGETWTNGANGLNGGARGVIAVSPASADVVYILMTNQKTFKALYKSTDAGISFTEQSTTPNIMDYSCAGTGNNGQAWYDLDLCADPTDANTIYAGGVNIFKSTDGGVSWNINAHWTGDCGVPAVHADQHVLEVNPLDNRIYAGNDGGLYWTDNGGQNWTEISSGLAISQVYRIGQSQTDSNLVTNGYQDNGSAYYHGNGWTTFMGGDGMETLVDYTDDNYRYGEYYYGSIHRFFGDQYQGGITNGISEEGAWVTPYILHETDPNTMFVGMNNVWRTKNVKASSTYGIQWTKISDGLFGGTISKMENAPADPNILYITDGSSIYRTDNAMDNAPLWLKLAAPILNGSTITDIETDANNADRVYVTKQNKVLQSNDRGNSWEDITLNLPAVNFNDIASYKNSPEGLYIGTDAGFYYKDQSMSEWMAFSDGFPLNGKVSEIDIYYDSENAANDRIRACSYGRGLWSSHLYSDTPAANFVADQCTVPVGCSVNFKDLSTGVPSTYNWTFEGGDPANSTEKNPTNITYTEAGTYKVSLRVENSHGSDELVRDDYITVSGSILPEPGFTADFTSFCASEDALVHFTDTSIYCPTDWSWSFDPADVTFEEGTDATSQNPVVRFNGEGPYSVSLTVSNPNGNNTITQANFIHIGGRPIPFVEDFESGLDAKGWKVLNPDNAVTWDISQVEGNQPGNRAVRMNFHDYLVPPGRRDQLISPALDFSAFENVHLSFQHAYAKQHAQVTDSLVVYASEDCGENWVRLFAAGEDGNGSFATHDLMEDNFVPQTLDDWCGNGWGSNCNLINLSAFAGKKNIKVMFESYNFYGNNLYIDNIEISNTVGIQNTDQNQQAFHVYPNPAHNFVSVYLHQNTGKGHVSLLNAQGQILKSQAISDKDQELKFSLKALPAGIYFIKWNHGQETRLEKLLVQ